MTEACLQTHEFQRLRDLERRNPKQPSKGPKHGLCQVYTPCLPARPLPPLPEKAKVPYYVLDLLGFAMGRKHMERFTVGFRVA